jgi:hypothetical protein
VLHILLGLDCLVIQQVSCCTSSDTLDGRCHIALSAPLMTSFIVAFRLCEWAKLRPLLNMVAMAESYSFSVRFIVTFFVSIPSS